MDRPVPRGAVQCSDLEKKLVAEAAERAEPTLSVRLSAVLRGAPWRKRMQFVVVEVPPTQRLVRFAAEEALREREVARLVAFLQEADTPSARLAALPARTVGVRRPTWTRIGLPTRSARPREWLRLGIVVQNSRLDELCRIPRK